MSAIAASLAWMLKLSDNALSVNYVAPRPHMPGVVRPIGHDDLRGRSHHDEADGNCHVDCGLHDGGELQAVRRRFARQEVGRIDCPTIGHSKKS